MKLKWMLTFFVLFFALAVKAQPKTVSTSETEADAESKYHFMLGYGSEYRPERDVEKNYSQHYMTNFAVGLGKGPWTFILEKSQFQESSGNATLNLERKYQDYLLNARYSAYGVGIFNAFAALAAGAYQESVTTNFSGQSLTSHGKYKLLTAGGLGVQATLSIIFVSVEARLLFGDELDQQASVSGLARIGLWF